MKREHVPSHNNVVESGPGLGDSHSTAPVIYRITVLVKSSPIEKVLGSNNGSIAEEL